MDSQNNDNAPPEAAPREVETPEGLLLGAPWAKVSEVDALDTDAKAGVPGCIATLRCSCGQMFRANLLTAQVKHCPGCKRAYTHAFIFCPMDDDGAVTDAMEHILEQNGYEVPRSADDDDDGQADDDDDETEPEDTDAGAGDDE